MPIEFNYKNYIPICEGGEGLIYKYDNKIIKIYKPNVDIKLAKNKIKSLVKLNLPKEIIKPLDIVVDKNKKFIGYIMDEVVDSEEIKKLTNKKFITANNINTKDILKMLVRIKELIEILHKNNIYIGDLNDKNILFDKNFNVYFIDCDSWSIDNNKCVMYMDTFLDPLINGIDFNSETDTYSFSIIAWEALTRVHPFGGTYKIKPEMNIMERMKKGISIIDNDNIIIPKVAKSWRNFSPTLLKMFKEIYENKLRSMNNELEDMYNNLTYCNKDKEYYYSKFTTCPLCNITAKVVIKPLAQGTVEGFNIISTLNEILVKTVINAETYLSNDNYIIDINTNRKQEYEYGCKYYFTILSKIKDMQDKFIVNINDMYYNFEKKYKSNIQIDNDNIYYITKQNTLTQVKVSKFGNSIKKIDACGIDSYFEVNNDNYCIINNYFGKVVANINGSNIDLEYNSKIINYGIHFDSISKSCLVILENKANKFTTFVVDKDNNIVYKNEDIYYNCILSNICFNNNTIFIPIDGNIRGYSYTKAIYKDFKCGEINDNSKLIKKGSKFIIVNDNNIFIMQ